MLGVDEGDDAVARLRLRQDLERERGLTRGLGSVDLDDTATGHAADAERAIEREGPGGNGLDLELRIVIPILHDGAFAELLEDGSLGILDAFLALLAGRGLVDLLNGCVLLGHAALLLALLSRAFYNEQLFVARPCGHRIREVLNQITSDLTQS